MKQIDKNHQSKRAGLRVAGIAILLTGLVFMAIGLIDFFVAASGFGAPKLFWCLFLGMPLLFVGGVLTSYGFMGSVARYSAAEMTPVATDTFNYAVDGTRDGIKHIASAIGAGLSDRRGAPALLVRCPKCNTATKESSRFCPECGAAMLKTSPCPDCGELNDADAKFCDNCGKQLGQIP